MFGVCFLFVIAGLRAFGFVIVSQKLCPTGSSTVGVGPCDDGTANAPEIFRSSRVNDADLWHTLYGVINVCPGSFAFGLAHVVKVFCQIRPDSSSSQYGSSGPIDVIKVFCSSWLHGFLAGHVSLEQLALSFGCHENGIAPAVTKFLQIGTCAFGSGPPADRLFDAGPKPLPP
eukprot:s154_g7.t1